MSKHRIAVIGLGMALGPHLKSLEDLRDRVEIAACYTPSDARRAAFAAKHPHPVAADLDAILADNSIDLAMILTPPGTHLALVEACAAAGKHVLVEKPIEVTTERARAAVAAMQKAQRQFAVMLQHRFRDASRKLEAVVKSGAMGPLISGSAQIRWWRPPEYYAQPGRGMKSRDGGGVLITQAIHTLDLFQHLAGPIAKVTAFARTSPLRRIDTEDMAGGGIEFENGAIGTVDATTVAYPGFPERIELACAKATAVLNAETLDIYWQDGRHDRHEGAVSKSGGADPMAFSHDAHKALITDFIDAVDANREPAVSGRSALRVQVLIDALLQSAQTQKPVALPST